MFWEEARGGEGGDSMNMHLGLSTLCHSQEVFANDKDKQKQFVFPTGYVNPFFYISKYLDILIIDWAHLTSVRQKSSIALIL